MQLGQLNYYEGLNNLIELSRLTAKSISNIVCAIEFQDDIYGNADRWIPNTEEVCKPFKINITGEDADQDPMNIPEYLDFKLLSPHDPNWSTNDEGNKNIHRNKGTCEYDMFAANQQGTNEKRLFTFEIKEDAASIDESYRVVEYNPEYFDSTGRIKSGYKLRVNAGGYLYFQIYDDPSYEYFTIKAVLIPGTTIRPGDDFLLRFTLSLLDYDGSIGVVSAGDFMAVYDKKLLWRANLYVDEGANDWNNVNPWNDSDDNNWYVSQADGADVDGGQIDIHSFTDIFNNERSSAVGYSFGCTDTPIFFNFELEEQRAARRAVTDDPILQETTAENGDWDNGYLFTQNLVHPYSPLNLDNINYFPYKPGYSSREYVNGNYTAIHTCYSAGVECQGLIMRAAGYVGNPYIDLYDIPENERMEWGVYVGKNLPGTGNWEAMSWEITVYEDEETSLVIPGDIIRIAGHLGIVVEVNYNDNRIATKEDIIIIEAWGFNMKVYNNRTWDDFYFADDEYKLCTIRRLTQN